MMKSEFEERISATVTPEDYKLIEKVYTYHPIIPEVGGKDKIAEIYKVGGMRLIRDMEDTANEAKMIEEAIMQKRREIAKLNEEFADLCRELNNLKK